jgi:hypothetical protein
METRTVLMGVNYICARRGTARELIWLTRLHTEVQGAHYRTLCAISEAQCCLGRCIAFCELLLHRGK